MAQIIKLSENINKITMDEAVYIIPDDIPDEDLQREEELQRPPSRRTSEPRQVTDLSFKKSLIRKVRKHRELYDTCCKLFSCTDAREKAWQKVAKEMRREVDECKNTWVNLRYRYQCHVRRLRMFFRFGNRDRIYRPVMALETELMFLWRYISDRGRWPNKSISVDPQIKNNVTPPNNEVIIVEESPIIVIDGDESEVSCKISGGSKHRQSLLLTAEARNFIEALQAYPDLYDTEHRYYHDYRRKGIIWNALANELKDKATKLMKLWIYLQTRYEWEINQFRSKDQSELAIALSFLKPHIMINPNTVYKQSFYLKKLWFEPVENFKSVFQMLVVLRRFPRIITYSDQDLLSGNIDNDYHSRWLEIARVRGTTAGQCEVTWLIMRYFYLELMSMRKHTYQLQDKWYFESIISDLYATAAKPKEKPTDTFETIDITTNSSPIPTITAANNSDKSVPATLNGATFNKSPATSTTIKEATTTTRKRKSSKATKAKTPKVPRPSTSTALYKQTVFNYGMSKQQLKSMTGAAAKLCGQSNPPTPEAALRSMTDSSAAFQMHIQSPLGSLSSPTPALLQPLIPTASPLTLPPPPTVNLTPLSPLTSLAAPIHTSVLPPATLTATPVRSLSSSGLSKLPMENTPLPNVKTTSALLGVNEIMIELLSTPNGNQLVVHGPALIEDFSMSMQTTANFIREIMAIPTLHNASIPAANNTCYWQHLARKFNLPVHICKACWHFLSENFHHFHRIAPIEELMKPFKTTLNVWQDDTKLFKTFEALAVERQWLGHINELSRLLDEFSLCSETLDALFVQNKPLPAHIHAKFAVVPDVYEICNAFRNVFVAYMSDLECGINNKWSPMLWPVLSKMEFLLDKNYKPVEPFYYIIGNKIHEEIMNGAQKAISSEIKESDAIITTEMTNNGKFFSAFDAYALLLCVRQHPHVYLKGTYWKRVEAWKEVAKQMNASVHDCRITFMRAVKEYHRYINRDPASRCRLNHKYFLPLSDIHRTVKTKKQLNIRTPSELNQAVANGGLDSHETVFPERFLIDVNMDNSKPALVMKNWSHAVGNLSTFSQFSVETELAAIFNKYRLLST